MLTGLFYSHYAKQKVLFFLVIISSAEAREKKKKKNAIKQDLHVL